MQVVTSAGCEVMDSDVMTVIVAQLEVPGRLGRAAGLRGTSGDFEAVFGRRMEARLQGE